MKNLTAIQTAKAPQPQGHYSQAVVANGFVFVSGILGIKSTDDKTIVRNFEEQTRICLDNLKHILEAAESKLSNVVKVTIYIDDISKWDKANNLYKEVFADHKPARVIVPTRTLHHGFEIEIDATALV